MSEKFDPYFEWLGIASVEQPPNHYHLLGIELFESDPRVIADAALQMMKLLRKYQVKHKSHYLKIAQEIARAKSHLVDADRKNQYDAQLKARDVVQNEIPISNQIDSPSEFHGCSASHIDGGLSENLPESRVLYDENIDKELAGYRTKGNASDNNDWHQIECYENGQKKYEVYFENNETDFIEIWWYENGQKESEVRYHCEDGKVDGHQLEWYENGQKRYEGYYKDGKINSVETWWHENGQRDKATQFKDGERNGPLMSWHENGQKEIEGHSKNDQLHGLYTRWDKNGKKTLEIQYKDGEEISRKEF